MITTLSHKTYIKGTEASPARFASWHLRLIDHYFYRKCQSPVTEIRGCTKKDMLATLAALYHHSGTSATRNREAVTRDAVRRFGAKSANAVRHALTHLEQAGVITMNGKGGTAITHLIGYRRADSPLTNHYLITIPQRTFRKLSFAMCRAIAAILIAYAHAKTNRHSGRKYVAVNYIHKVAQTHFDATISLRTIYKAIRAMGATIEREQLLVPVQWGRHVQKIIREGLERPANTRVIHGTEYELGPAQVRIRDGAFGITKQPHLIKTIVKATNKTIITNDDKPWRTFEDTHYVHTRTTERGHHYERLLAGFAPWTYYLQNKRHKDNDGNVNHKVTLPDGELWLIESWGNGRKTFDLVGQTANNNINHKARYLAGALSRLGVQGTPTSLYFTALRMLRGTIFNGTTKARRCGMHVKSTRLCSSAAAALYEGPAALFFYSSRHDCFAFSEEMVDEYKRLLKAKEGEGFTYSIKLHHLEELLSQELKGSRYTSCVTRPIPHTYDCKASHHEEEAEEPDSQAAAVQPAINAEPIVKIVSPFRSKVRGRLTRLLREAGQPQEDHHVDAVLQAVLHGMMPEDETTAQALIPLLDDAALIIQEEEQLERERLKVLGMRYENNLLTLLQ